MSQTTPLPPFGVRSLHGPHQPPALVQITSREYDETVASHNDAHLLYLDDDDGELITVGSGLELGQRLEEPVPLLPNALGAALLNPVDDNPVHIFDIRRTRGSLAFWRQHEAYASKDLEVKRRPSVVIDADLELPSASRRVKPDTLPFTNDNLGERPTIENDQSRLKIDTGESGIPESDPFKDPESPAAEVEKPADVFLQGIIFHLGGLADVLQGASEVFRKAADKTREADTTVADDVLRGVKDILVEVGGFGFDMVKCLVDDFGVRESKSVVPPANGSETAAQKDSMSVPAQQSKVNTSALTEQIRRHQAWIPPVPTVEQPRGNVGQPLRPCLLDSRLKPSMPPPPNVSSSILDGESSDAEFTARYPPLLSIHRAHTVKPLQRPTFLSELPGPAKPVTSFVSETRNNVSAEKAEIGNAVSHAQPDVCSYPLPGAWPETKSDQGTAGRTPFNAIHQESLSRPPPFSPPGWTTDRGNCRLNRFNTISHENPASRLRRPFDDNVPSFVGAPTSRSRLTPHPFQGKGPFSFTSNGLVDRATTELENSSSINLSSGEPDLPRRRWSPPHHERYEPDRLTSRYVPPFVRRGQGSSGVSERSRPSTESWSDADRVQVDRSTWTSSTSRALGSDTASNHSTIRLPDTPNFTDPTSSRHAARHSQVSFSDTTSVIGQTGRAGPGRRPFADARELCIQKLKELGFGEDDEKVASRLPVYAAAANNDVAEAVEMIEEDRRVARTLRWTGF